MTEFFATFTPEVIWGGILVFLLRVLDMSMDTLRVLFVVRGKKAIVWFLGVFQSIIYIVAIGNVLTGKTHPFIILCYACGFATGNILGMFIESKLGIGFRQLSVISKEHGDEIADELRKKGFGVTVMAGVGRDGVVTIINTSVKRRQVAEAHEVIDKIDPDAFITEDDFTPLNRGHWRK